MRRNRSFISVFLFLFVCTNLARSFKVNSISPSRGSIGGNTLVTITGSGFSPDLFSKGTVVRIDGLPCKVEWFYSGENAIACRTPANPWVQEGGSLWNRKVEVLVGSDQDSSKRFSYTWGTTPRVIKIHPSAVSVGSSIAILMENFAPDPEAINRVFVGDQICELRDTDHTNAFYGVVAASNSRYTWIHCSLQQSVPGLYNVSVAVDNVGLSWNSSNALFVGPDRDLAMVEVYPRIDEVSPQVGSVDGGTVVTITGTGFDVDPTLVEVDVDGIPCEVLSVSLTQIVCQTGKPPPNHSSIADNNNNYPAVAEGFRFRGSRGVSVEQYPGANSQMDSLFNLDVFPDNPDSHLTYPTFEPPEAFRRDNYGERYSAFFTPLMSGEQRLWLASDDDSELHISMSSNISNTTRIAYVKGFNSWNIYTAGLPWGDWRRYSQQRADPMDLDSSESYLLVGYLAEGSNHDFLRVGVHYPASEYKYNQTQQSVREEQVFTLSTEVTREKQRLTVLVNLTELNNENPSAVEITWGGRTSLPISVLELNDTELVEERIMDLFYSKCEFEQAGIANVSYFDFESNVGWPRWGGINPEIMEYEQYCGRYSIMVRDDGARPFDISPDDDRQFNIEDYPYLCMGYKIPPELNVVLPIKLKEGNSYHWYDISFIGERNLPFTEEIVDDDNWHYECYNMDPHVKYVVNQTGRNYDEYVVLGLGVYFKPVGSSTTLYFDDVAFVSNRRTLRPERIPAARPNGVALNSLDVEVIESNPTDDIWNVTVVMEILPSLCDYQIPLMNVSIVEGVEAVGEATIDRLQSASEPLGGEYTLTFKGVETRALNYDATASEVQLALQEVAPNIDALSSWTRPLSSDTLMRYCPGRRISVRFERLPGDQPFIEVNTANLTGTGVNVQYYESWQGGLFVRPLRGFMLQTAELAPQVHVRVREHLSACGPDSESSSSRPEICNFVYSPRDTPSVTSVVPTMVRSGDAVTITGEGFGDSSPLVQVQLGDVRCDVTAVSDTSISCTARDGSSGTKSVEVLISPIGRASVPNLVVEYNVSIVSITPSSVSLGGGNVVNISGSGFLPNQCQNAGSDCSCNDFMVLIDGEEADISYSSGTDIIVTTPPSSTRTAGAVSVTVSITCDDGRVYADTLASGITYTANSATVSGMAPAEGAAGGGTVVTITGMNLPTDAADITVLIGDAPCSIMTTSATSVSCVTSPHLPGDYPVNVQIVNMGNALPPVGGLMFSYLLNVSEISHCQSSLFGGRSVEITGSGFGTNVSAVEVSFGSAVCDVFSVSDTTINCTTRSSSAVHYITNNAINEQYGLGYKWAPSELTVEVGDTVEWSWIGVPFAQWFSVAQVTTDTATKYSGYGFRSASSVLGSYSFTFHTPGVYYFIGENYAHIGMRGVVNVISPEDKEVPITVVINGITAPSSEMVPCNNPTSCSNGETIQDGHFYFGNCSTPVIDSVSPSTAHPGGSVLVSVRMVSSDSADNLITVGGLPCQQSNGSLYGDIDVSDQAQYIGDAPSDLTSTVVNCTLPLTLSAGNYWVQLHVRGLGFGYAVGNDSKLTIQPIVYDVEPSSGSLRGETLVKVTGSGFSTDPLENRVLVGNSNCFPKHVATNDDGMDELLCYTLNAIDDGYSSLVRRLHPTGYWTFQHVYYYHDGTYASTDFPVIRNHGSTGAANDGSERSGVLKGQVGISGNSFSGQSVKLNPGSIEVQHTQSLFGVFSFSLELWLRTADGIQSFANDYTTTTSYRVILSSSSTVSGSTTGFLLVLNPCEELELWYAPEWMDPSTTADCELITSDTDCPASCSGLYQVDDTLESSLPGGYWNVLRGPQVDVSSTDWTHIVAVWRAAEDTPPWDLLGSPSDVIDDSISNSQCLMLDSGVSTCFGSWLLNVHGQLANSTSLVSYTQNANGAFVVGGSGDGYYVGYLDDVAVYPTALSTEDVSNHHSFGTTQDQPVSVSVEGVEEARLNGEFSSTSVDQYQMMEVDWNDAQNGQTITLESPTIITFHWNSSHHGLYQVDQLAYESCDLSSGHTWHRGASIGTVSIAFKENRTWYLVDTIEHNCRNGFKLTVKLGNIHEIVWGIPSAGQSYEDITISRDTTLLFKWSAGYHNLVEIRDVPSRDVCLFATSQFSGSAVAVGQVEAQWRETSSVTGEVYVSDLSVGDHYFVCTVGSHCTQGMNIKVTVTDYDNTTAVYKEPTAMDTVSVYWAIRDYSTLEIHDRTNILFAWDDFHSLLQVDAEAYDTCDVDPAKTLVEWSRPSVDSSVVVPHLSPGTYYFICGVAGHCRAGMKLQVVVYPLTILPALKTPVEAVCDGQCVFAYTPEDTPRLRSVNPNHASGGAIIQINGTGLLNSGSSVAMVSVWIGEIPCNNVNMIGADGGMESIECTVEDFESGYYFVDVHNDRGLAAVHDVDSPGFGPHRNASEQPRQDSPYTVFFLAASVDSISPSNGSLNGGTAVTITGSGFTHFPSHAEVSLGNCLCSITASSLSTIACLTTHCGDVDISTLSDVPVSVEVRINGFPASSSVTFQYSVTRTPVIDSIVSENSDVTEGDNITIIGERLEGDNVAVKLHNLADESIVGDCEVHFQNDSVIVCTVPALSAGDYQTVVRIPTTGYSLERSDGSAGFNYGLALEGFEPAMSGNGGGVTLTISGSGFPQSEGSNNLAVSICETPCTVTTSSFASVTCIVGARATTDPTANDAECPVVVSVNGVSETSTDLFTYNGTLTPYISDLSPTFGGTAGGTFVTVSGWGFWPPDVTSSGSLANGDITVTIDGVPCVLSGTSAQDSLTCRTSRHRTSLQARVVVLVRGRGTALDLNDKGFFDYVDKWSSPYTWGGQPPPLEGETVYIRSGETIFLDTDTPVLNLILIEGSLIFEDNQNIHLQAKYIFINTGKLQIGTEDSPFMHKAVVTLHGTVKDPEIPVYGAKVIGVRQGDLDLHGKPRNVTWTRLQETAAKNDTFLLLQEAVDWVEGDNIVIAPTGKDGNETEVGVVMSVEQEGYRVNLATPLRYTHFGITETFEDGQFIEIRAEVGLLTHNVVVQGSVLEDPTGYLQQGADMYGAQILVHRAGPHPTPIRIEHAEFRHMGQAFRLGRYALHFHLSGSMNGSYIRNCAIHHSFNRAITAHGVHDVLIEGNVAYDIMGHTYFVEDGIETDNSYIHNLGVLTRGSSSLLNTDQIPATFWITNPQNIFRDNAAAASRAYGFWYDLDNFPSGPSFTTSVCPNKMPFGVFENNVAHTCSEFGLRIWESYIPFADGCLARNRTTAKLYNFTTYNNGIHGLEFSVVGHVQIHGFKVADNRDNGIEIQETHGFWGGPLIKDTLVVSHTRAISGSPGTGGIKTPNTPRLTISNVTFVNFNTSGTSCLRACSHCKVFQGGFQVWLNGIKFLGQSELNKAAFQWEHEVLFWDQDGSFSGNVDGWVLPDSNLLPTGVCQRMVPEYSVGNYPGAVCTSETYFLRMAWNQAQPLATLAGVDVNVTNEFGSSRVPWRHYRLTHLDGYMFVFPSGYDHSVVWLLPTEHEVDTTSYSAGVYGVRPDSRGWITHTFVITPNHIEVGGNYESEDQFPQNNDEIWSWFIDNSTNVTQGTYLVTGLNQTEEMTDYSFSYLYRSCPRSGCPRIRVDRGPVEAGYRLWSNESSWPSGRLPEEGEDVTIMSSWRMLLDMSPPALGRVDVFGELKFQDEQDLNFTANVILVTGFNGRLTVGEEGSPFQHKATITLTGRIGTPDLLLARDMNLGSKALGIFSNVSLVGQPVQSWSRLMSSAASGSTVITVENLRNLNWPVGGEVVIAPSGYDPTEAEVRRIVAINGNSITLDRELEQSHNIVSLMPSADIPTDGSWQFGNLKYSPEVGLLTRNIVVQGGEDPGEPLEDHHYGCRVLVGQYKYDEDNTFIGKAEFSSVEFRFCGQGGYFSPFDPRYAIAFKGLSSGAEGSYVRSCSIHHGYNTAIGVHRSDSVDIDGNVVYRTTDSSFQIGGSRNRVVNNLCILTSTIQPNTPLDNHAVDFPASFEVDEGNILRYNHASGSTRVGFQYNGEPCKSGHLSTDEDSALFWGNTAHTNLIGLLIMGATSQCTAIGGFTSYLNWDFGVFSSIASRLVVSHSVVASGKVGLNLNIFGPNPVAHLLGRKWIKLENTLIVGLTEGEECLSSGPPNTIQGVSFSSSSIKHGIMMSSFNQKRSKMDGTGPFHLMKGYPVIDGRLEITNVTFARFFSLENCHYQPFAITNNPLSPDAVHPAEVRGVVKINVDRLNIAHFYDPKLAWINQEDCIDMDCDGPKHALIQDMDGSLLDNKPNRGSIIPNAQLRFDYTRIPNTWLANENFPMRRAIVEKKGIDRGTEADITPVGCEWLNASNAYHCVNISHYMLVFESMDPDTEVRRLSPIALVGGDSHRDEYTDLLNGPMDHGWCTYYTCLKRLSTFFSIVSTGATNSFHIWSTGTNPKGLRFHLLNAPPDEGVLLHIWYQDTFRKDVYKDGIYIASANTKLTTSGAAYEVADDSFIPLYNSFSGDNYFDRNTHVLHVLVKGDTPIEIRTPPVVVVSLTVTVSFEDFFSPEALLSNLAFVLEIPLSSIRQINVIEEDSPLGRRKRQVNAGNGTMEITLELGSAPKNISTPGVSTVEEQLNNTSTDSVDDGSSQDAELTNGTGIVMDTQPEVVSDNIYNEDPPANDDSYLNEYSEMETAYQEEITEYMTIVQEATAANDIAETLVMLVQTQSLELDNVTVDSVSVQPAEVAPPPEPPVIPPEYNTTVETPAQPVEPYQPVKSGDSNGSALPIYVPHGIVLVQLPPVETGNLVYLQVEARDAKGFVITHLGISQPWNCVVTVTGGTADDGSLPTLAGITSVPFLNGRATFTRLRVNEISTGVLLQLSTDPGNLQVSTTTPFSVVPPPSTVPRTTIHFKLSGDYGSIESDKQGFITAMQNAIAMQIDIDISRLQNIQVFNYESIIVQLDILDTLDSDPPDAPSLTASLLSLRNVINNNSLSFQFSNNVYTSKESSFQEGPFSAPDTTTIALIAGLGAAGCLALLLIAAILFFCGCKILRKNAKKNKVSTSARCPVDDEDRRNNYGYGYRNAAYENDGENVIEAFELHYMESSESMNTEKSLVDHEPSHSKLQPLNRPSLMDQDDWGSGTETPTKIVHVSPYKPQ